MVYRLSSKNPSNDAENISIILVAPQMGENIGAAARAMKNFGVSDLRLVAPRDGWPNSKAEAMSAFAIDIINSAKIYDSLHEACSDLEYLYATTASVRDINKESVSSHNLSSDFRRGRKVGIMFGRESNGLTNSEISLANKIINIPTVDSTSLNIAQAIVIVCYEIAFSLQSTASHARIQQSDLSTRGELEYYLNRLFDELDQSSFFRVKEKKPLMMQNISNIFTRIDNLSKSELQTLHGIINALKNTSK